MSTPSLRHFTKSYFVFFSLFLFLGVGLDCLYHSDNDTVQSPAMDLGRFYRYFLRVETDLMWSSEHRDDHAHRSSLFLSSSLFHLGETSTPSRRKYEIK
jgi:hypothetical protein